MKQEQIGLYRGECWVETFTGKFVNPLKLEPDDIDIRDIAHALSLICRFNGHCSRFYSVGEHCIRVSGILQGRDTQLAGLLHDASEAYMADIARPVKWALPQIREAEGAITIAINTKYNLRGDWRAIKRADNILLATEARDLMSTNGQEWYLPDKPLEYKINPMPSDAVETGILELFAKLFKS